MPDTENTPEPSEETQDDAQQLELGDGGEKALKAERDARRTAEKQLREARKAASDALAQVKQFEDANKSETQKALDQIAELKKALTDKDTVIAAKDRETQRATVAAAKGVPANLVTGDTPEDMEASAEAALEWRGTERKPIGALRSGASAGPAKDAKERAAEALRAMWQNK